MNKDNIRELFEGDCLEIMKGIPDGSIDMILADPPYGTTACKWDSIIDFKLMWEQLHRIIKPNGAIVLFGSQPFTSALIMSNPKMFKYCWIWEKSKASNFVHSNFQPLKIHEDIIIFSKGGAAQGSKTPMIYNKQMIQGEPYKRGFVTGGRKILQKGLKGVVINNESGLRTPRSVVKINNPSGKGHLFPTMKPVALFEYLIKTYTNEGDIVLDNVAGSGTTGEACDNINRQFILIEKEKKYCDIIRNRLNIS